MANRRLLVLVAMLIELAAVVGIPSPVPLLPLGIAVYFAAEFA